MRRSILGLGLVLTLALGVGTLLACHDEGGAEKVGKKLDDAVDKLTHPNEGPLEKLGRKTDEAVDDAKDAIDDAMKND